MITTEQLTAAGLPPAAEFAAIDVTTGVDVVDIPRLMRLAQRPGGLPTALTERELAYCHSRPQPGEHLAACYAAKEAVLRAFGTTLPDRIRSVDIEILKETGHRPTVVLHGAARVLAEARRLCRLDISLSHTGGLALAQAVAVWGSATAAGAAHAV